MAETTDSVERDLREAQAMVEGLVPYIYEDELYGRLGGNMPSLTLGALLMRLRRLRELHGRLTPAQAAALQRIEAQHESLRREWQTHYLNKMRREIDSRLNNLNTYFKECDDDPRLCASAYLPEALRRTIIQELLLAVPDGEIHQTGLEEKFRRSDARLRRYVRPSNFLWDEVLKPAYQEQTFWWLYNRPPHPDDNDVDEG